MDELHCKRRMRISAHTAVAAVAERTIHLRVAAPKTASSTSAGNAIKPTSLSTIPTTGSDPFASIFQTFSQAVASNPGPTAATTAAAAATPVPTATSTTTATAPAPAQTGIAALVNAIQNGTLQVSYVTDPSQLKETTPWGTDTVSPVNYASDQTAAQLAQLLGGKVVQMPAFQDGSGWNEPMANFIELPNGMTFNAADVAYYGATPTPGGTPALTACLTATINQGAAWTSYRLNGGTEPSFAGGYIGPPISGLTYPPGTIGSDGNVIMPNG